MFGLTWMMRASGEGRCWWRAWNHLFFTACVCVSSVCVPQIVARSLSIDTPAFDVRPPQSRKTFSHGMYDSIKDSAHIEIFG